MSSLHFRFRFASLFVVVLAFSLSSFVGCAPDKKAAKEKDAGGIFGKETDKIGEFDPNADREIKAEDGSDINIVTGSLGAYGFAVRETSRLHIKRAVDLFHAAEGRYPKDHAEFMSKIIKANKIKLPEPPTTQEYQYDVEKHELVVVMKKKG